MHLIEVMMPSRQNLAPHASSAVTQSNWDPASTSSDGPGGNKWQMLSEGNLEPIKSIRPVKPFPGSFPGQASPQAAAAGGCPPAEPWSTPALRWGHALETSGSATLHIQPPRWLSYILGTGQSALPSLFLEICCSHWDYLFFFFFFWITSVGSKSQSPCSLPVTYRAIKIVPSCYAAI